MPGPRTLSHLILAGRWRFVNAVGAGSDGTVYRALDTQTGREVAIKVYDSMAGRAPDEIRAMLSGQAWISEQAASPWIVQVIAHGIARGETGAETGYLVMEYLRGATLRGVLDEAGGRVPDRFALRLLQHILAALASLHDAGVVHLDVKPENIFLLESGDEQANSTPVKLFDFGAARRSSEASDGSARGTPLYAAPEVCLRADTVGPGSDLYALGILLYELLVGHPPLQVGSSEQIVAQHVYGELDPLPPPWAGTAVDEVYRRATEKPPYRRYHTAHQMAVAVRSAMRGLT